jgi:coenzyme F420 hydrogenase subunit beta
MHDTMALIRRNGGDPELQPPVTLRWRGNGCPGPFVAAMADGSEVTATYNDMWVDNKWTTQFRCKICPDAIGMQADFVAADSWPDAIANGESEGTNVVIARTEIGAEVLAACEREGYLHVEDAGHDILDYTQPHQTRLRQSFGARLAGALVGGVPVPNFNGLAEDVTAAELSPDDLANVFKGTIARVRAGQSDERVVPEDWEDR